MRHTVEPQIAFLFKMSPSIAGAPRTAAELITLARPVLFKNKLKKEKEKQVLRSDLVAMFTLCLAAPHQELCRGPPCVTQPHERCGDRALP